MKKVVVVRSSMYKSMAFQGSTNEGESKELKRFKMFLLLTLWGLIIPFHSFLNVDRKDTFFSFSFLPNITSIEREEFPILLKVNNTNENLPTIFNKRDMVERTERRKSIYIYT